MIGFHAAGAQKGAEERSGFEPADEDAGDDDDDDEEDGDEEEEGGNAADTEKTEAAERLRALEGCVGSQNADASRKLNLDQREDSW